AQQAQVSTNPVQQKRVNYAYTPAGDRRQVTRWADVAGTRGVATTDWGYDEGGRLREPTHRANTTGTVLNAYRWSYDALGRPVSESSSDGVSTWQYDASSQVTAADHTRQASERYTYDATGNRTAATQSSGTANTITTGANNRLLADDRYRYEYDAEGNRTRRIDLEFLTKHPQALTAAFEDCLIKSRDDSRAISKALNNTRRVMNDAESLAKKLSSFYKDVQWTKLMTAAQLLILAHALASSGQAMANPTPEQQQYRDHFYARFELSLNFAFDNHYLTGEHIDQLREAMLNYTRSIGVSDNVQASLNLKLTLIEVQSP
ncbi:MAG: hypothetical protein ACK5F7_06695, partial [Planctomycetaceae bacterium]